MLDADYPEAGIAILGVNQAGFGDNEGMCQGRDLPWLQDTVEADWWGNWGVTYRDVVILDREGNEAGVFNLTQHDLQNPEAYDTLTTMLLDIAGL